MTRPFYIDIDGILDARDIVKWTGVHELGVN